MEGTVPRIDPEAVLAHRMPEGTCSYTERDIVLYALGVGACGVDPCDSAELAYVYNEEGQDAVKVLPTFAVLFSHRMMENLGTIPGLNFLPSMLLHGEQYLEIYKSLPTSGQVTYQPRVSQLQDKEKAALLEIENICRDSQSGEVLCMSRSTFFLRGAGGFSKAGSQLYAYEKRSPSITPLTKLPVLPPPKSASVTVHEDRTLVNQALLYRLSGDYNPLHSDPEVAKIAGYPKPILHGLCSLGFAVRAVIRHFCQGEPSLVQTVQGRFMLHVYPGETLITKMWRDHTERIFFLCSVKERSRPVLSGVVSLHPSARL